MPEPNTETHKTNGHTPPPKTRGRAAALTSGQPQTVSQPGQQATTIPTKKPKKKRAAGTKRATTARASPRPATAAKTGRPLLMILGQQLSNLSASATTAELKTWRSAFDEAWPIYMRAAA